MIYFACVFQLTLVIRKGEKFSCSTSLSRPSRLHICEQCTITEAVVGQSGFRVCFWWQIFHFECISYMCSCKSPYALTSSTSLIYSWIWYDRCIVQLALALLFAQIMVARMRRNYRTRRVSRLSVCGACVYPVPPPLHLSGCVGWLMCRSCIFYKRRAFPLCVFLPSCIIRHTTLTTTYFCLLQTYYRQHRFEQNPSSPPSPKHHTTKTPELPFSYARSFPISHDNPWSC
jgi:hypothetical protein